MCGPAIVALRRLLLFLIILWQLCCHIPLTNGQNVTNAHTLLDEGNLIVIERFLVVMQKFLEEHFPANDAPEPTTSEPEVVFQKMPLHAKECCGKGKTTPKPITPKPTTPKPTTPKPTTQKPTTPKPTKTTISTTTTTTPRPTTTSTSPAPTTTPTTTTTTEKPRKPLHFIVVTLTACFVLQ